MNDLEELLYCIKTLFEETPLQVTLQRKQMPIVISALEKQIPKKVYHFLEDDTFETTCCGYDVTNQDFNYCPNCGQSLGKIEEVEGEDE